MIADAVFLPVGVVGMAGPELFGDIAVVLAALILVADQEGDRRPRGVALEHAGENFHLIRFTPLGHMTGGAGLAPVQFRLDIGRADCQSGRAAVHHATNGRAMGFAEGSDAKQGAEGIARHGRALRSSAELSMTKAGGAGWAPPTD